MTITPQKPWVISDLGRVGLRYRGGHVTYPKAVMPIKSFEVITADLAIITTLNGDKLQVTGSETVAGLMATPDLWESAPRPSRGRQGEWVFSKTRPTPCCSWIGMIKRCYGADTSNYKWYGAKGVRVCDEWYVLGSDGSPTREGLLNFVADMGERPGRKSLHLIDVDQPYGPNNCVWKVGREDPDLARYFKAHKREQT